MNLEIIRQFYMGLKLLHLRKAQREITSPVYLCCHRHVHKCELCSVDFWLPAPKMYVVHRSMNTTEAKGMYCD